MITITGCSSRASRGICRRTDNRSIKSGVAATNPYGQQNQNPNNRYDENKVNNSINYSLDGSILTEDPAIKNSNSNAELINFKDKLNRD